MSKWISVDDRLPTQDYFFVLVAQEGAGVVMAQFRIGTRGFYASDGDSWSYPLLYVTHWQPLPEPPT